MDKIQPLKAAYKVLQGIILAVVGLVIYGLYISAQMSEKVARELAEAPLEAIEARDTPLTAELLIEEFRNGFEETDPAAPKFVRENPHREGPLHYGQDLTAAEIATLAKALAGEPWEVQFLWIRLYGVNQRLRAEVKEMRDRLGLENRWPKKSMDEEQNDTSTVSEERGAVPTNERLR